MADAEPAIVAGSFWTTGSPARKEFLDTVFPGFCLKLNSNDLNVGFLLFVCASSMIGSMAIPYRAKSITLLVKVIS